MCAIEKLKDECFFLCEKVYIITIKKIMYKTYRCV